MKKLPTQNDVHKQYAKENFPEGRQKKLDVLRSKMEGICSPKSIGHVALATAKPATPRLDAAEQEISRLGDVVLALAQRVELLSERLESLSTSSCGLLPTVDEPLIYGPTTALDTDVHVPMNVPWTFKNKEAGNEG